MSKKRESPSKIQNATAKNEQFYMHYDPEDKESVEKAFASGISGYTGRVHSSHNRMGFSPFDVGGDGPSGRYGLTHSDYEAWRPDEQTRFKNPKHAILHAEICYQRHGLIKNVIDIMGDFASQGIRLVHPNKRIEKFFQNWFRKVRGAERSERFANNLIKVGNVVVRAQTAKITPKGKEKLFKARATPDMEIVDKKTTKNEIPMKYTFLHPATVEVVGGPLANFLGDPQYVISIPRGVSNLIKKPRNSEEQLMVDALPSEIKQAVKSSKPIPLPKDKTWVYHYKKDDWQDWAFPMITSIALDISLYDKLKLADRAALDGAISNIRIFKIGNLEHKIAPTDLAVEKLASILESNTQAGTLDLIWGPDIEMVESKTAVHQFLGQGKYEPTLMALYAGLGIPPTLTGTFGASGTTNNFISLKTLIQRLQYVRDVLTQFWDSQIKIVQEAMGFRFPARVEFDLMNLGDEVAEKSLLIQLSDRNIISDELMQHYFGNDPEMERIRINREFKDREAGRHPEKSGPFYDPQADDFDTEVKKMGLQTGINTPSELGVDLKPRKKGEEPALKMRQLQKPPGGSKDAKKKGVPGQGRPKNKKDSDRRQPKQFKPKTKASVHIWASAAHDTIAHIVNPILLHKYNKKNMRSLSSLEYSEAEKIKFSILCTLEPMCNIDEKAIYNSLDEKVSKNLLDEYNSLAKTVEEELNRELNINERKDLQAQFYASLFQETES